MRKPWTSPNYEGRSPWTSDGFLHGRVLAEQAARWIETHPQQFNSLYRIVKRMQSEGVQGRVRDRAVVEAMALGITFEQGGYTFANGLWAGLTRYMAYADPSLIGNPLQFSRSDIDTYGLPQVTFTLNYYTTTIEVKKDEDTGTHD